ncbi:MAG TPA: radical SAM protein, partial [Flavobacteriales bacterium]|nr:radical SAM protein [Flavobacteriales bacterium]
YNFGFTRLSLGIQDFDEAVQKCINRKQSYEQVNQLTQQARAIGYESVNYDLIYGLPLQTRDTVKKTIEKVLELKPDRIAFYSYAHVPWLKPGQRRYTEKDLPNAALKRSLYECGRNMFEKAGYEETGMDHFALPNDALSIAKYNKKLYRNFMGYTTFAGELLIGLGVSSISDTGGAFAQNEKTVEDYYARIQSYEIPVTKGHILTKEDIILRKHIMSIMCHEETNWNNPDTQCSTINEALPDLLEMEADGLINLKQQGIKVTDTGKPFLRNICMAFDARLQHKKQTNQLFSKSI